MVAPQRGPPLRRGRFTLRPLPASLIRVGTPASRVPPTLTPSSLEHELEQGLEHALDHVVVVRAAAYSNVTFETSYSRVPLPVFNVTDSPCSLPIIARASGAEMAIRPALMSAS